MRKVILYIATSIDNYIAKKNGDVNWLFTDGDYGYTDFFESIDITLMGNKTYRQILTFGEFPYKEKENYVFTRQKNTSDTIFAKMISGNIVMFTEDLKIQSGKSIWLIGGSEIIELFMNNNLVDELIILIHPIILGEGIPLISKRVRLTELKFERSTQFESGLIQIYYSVFKN